MPSAARFILTESPIRGGNRAGSAVFHVEPSAKRTSQRSRPARLTVLTVDSKFWISGIFSPEWPKRSIVGSWKPKSDRRFSSTSLRLSTVRPLPARAVSKAKDARSKQANRLVASAIARHSVTASINLSPLPVLGAICADAGRATARIRIADSVSWPLCTSLLPLQPLHQPGSRPCVRFATGLAKRSIPDNSCASYIATLFQWKLQAIRLGHSEGRRGF